MGANLTGWGGKLTGSLLYYWDLPLNGIHCIGALCKGR